MPAWKTSGYPDRESFNAHQRQYYKSHPEKRNTLKGRFARFKYRAAKREIDMTLTFEQWSGLVEHAHCHYCLERIQSFGISLDRKNSQLGYCEGNVVPCCGTCNRIRNEDLISYEEMLYIMPLLLEFRKRR
jgi:hypothetical protein